jgi:hypothetical protein
MLPCHSLISLKRVENGRIRLINLASVQGSRPAALKAALRPVANAAQALGVEHEEAESLMADIFAHAAGLLLLAHTGRIRIFGASAPDLMERFVERAIVALTEK